MLVSKPLFCFLHCVQSGAPKTWTQLEEEDLGGQKLQGVGTSNEVQEVSIGDVCLTLCVCVHVCQSMRACVSACVWAHLCLPLSLRRNACAAGDRWLAQDLVEAVMISSTLARCGTQQAQMCLVQTGFCVLAGTFAPLTFKEAWLSK